MRITIMCLAVLASACGRPPSTQTGDSVAIADSSVKIAGTKFQRFSAKTGAVIIKGFQEAGTLRGQLGTRVTAEARELTDASDGSRADGVALEVTGSSSLTRSATSFIDYDEIESLIKGLDYIAHVDKSITKLANFQADYATRGDLRISAFNDSEGKVSMAVESGSIGGVTAYFAIGQAAELKTLIEKARVIVDQARPAKAKP